MIAEARETGTAGIYRADGEVRMGLIDEIAHAIDPRAADLRGAARAISRCGCSSASARECNLGNIAPDDVLSLETLRLGLRSDTVERFALGWRGAIDRRPASASLARVVFARWCSRASPRSSFTQHLKHTPTVVQLFKLTPHFSPTPAGHIKQERISFRLAHADEVTVAIDRRRRRRGGDAGARSAAGTLHTALAACGTGTVGRTRPAP